MTEPIIIIPARMAAERLPGKPLVDIAGLPLIVHVWRRAQEAGLGPVVVATDTAEIARAVEAAGGSAIMTRADLASGSDRVFEAVTAADRDGRHDVVINLQGDMPDMAPQTLRAATVPLADPAVDIGTAATATADPRLAADPNLVKVIGTQVGANRLRALYFTRGLAPWGQGDLLLHIGVYAFRRSALTRFAALPPSPLEKRERLEQLRALEAGMRIDVALVDAMPIGVDTPVDLQRARACFEARTSGKRES
ncbi:MAG: 3-deoxy-manno-octulosonate cytidylyltransferase synthetase [Methylobacteriaceae bacterium]|jgi:3-deoxy-manno-octulosonate cytidylyltransferase (CMP-KDO synthetase)|nr:3-deoxy-manno-octulosonate cytidylyltransferase synthetase [Methylobacteriaceae bacterium]